MKKLMVSITIGFLTTTTFISAAIAATSSERKLDRCVYHSANRAKEHFPRPIKKVEVFGHEFNCHAAKFSQRDVTSGSSTTTYRNINTQISHAKRFRSDEQIYVSIHIEETEKSSVDSLSACKYRVEYTVDYKNRSQLTRAHHKAIAGRGDWKHRMRTARESAKRRKSSWGWRDSLEWLVVGIAKEKVPRGCINF